MTDAATLGIDLLESFEQLVTQLSQFADHLQADQDLPLWISLTDQELASYTTMRQKAVLLFRTLWYEDGQDGRETLTCPGIVGASPSTVEAALRLNNSKDRFKAAVLALKQLNKTQTTALLSDLHRRNEEVARAMRRMGNARLNLKQAYRHVPLLPQRPIKIGFTWSKQGRTIQRTTVAEARRLLERRSATQQTQAELQRLQTIPETEILARVRSTSPHLRANVVYQNPDDGLERRLVQAPLPILIPLAAGEPLPEFVPIPPEPTGQVRLKRSDVRIEDEPFLPLIRLHRYQQAYRQ